jgi:hypothetical protein
MHDAELTFDDEGNLVVVYHPNDTEVQQIVNEFATITADRRVGHVWPAGAPKRLAFRLLRKVFGSKGALADWTRTWRGAWIVVLVDTGEALPATYPSHDAAVEVEVAWSLAQEVTP